MISGSACEPIGAPGKHFKPPIMDRILFCFVCCFFFAHKGRKSMPRAHRRRRSRKKRNEKKRKPGKGQGPIGGPLKISRNPFKRGDPFRFDMENMASKGKVSFRGQSKISATFAFQCLFTDRRGYANLCKSPGHKMASLSDGSQEGRHRVGIN